MKGKKSTSEDKKLKGTFKPSREVEPITLPKVQNIETPTGLINSFATDEWVKVTDHLNNNGMLCESYYTVLLMYCNEVGMYWQCSADLKTGGLFYESRSSDYQQARPQIRIMNTALNNAVKIGATFGLDPLSRSKLVVEKKDDNIDPLKDFLK